FAYQMGSDSIRIQLHPEAPIGFEKELECSARSESNKFCSNSDSPTDSNSSEAGDGDNGRSILIQQDAPSMGRSKSYEIKVRNLSYAIVINKPSPYMFHPCGLGGEKRLHQILNNISCDAKPGQISAIVGPSGA
ncbi:hypothetical protein KI387_024139, partial [Taxus chinensis]